MKKKKIKKKIKIEHCEWKMKLKEGEGGVSEQELWDEKGDKKRNRKCELEKSRVYVGVEI